MLGNDIVAKAAPDGYTVLLGITAMIQSPGLYKKIPYNVERDFAPVSLVARSSDLFVVPNRVPARTLAEFVALAKASPGKLSYGSYGNGTSAHLHGEQLKMRAGIDWSTFLQGAAPLVSDVLGGQVDSAFVDVTSANAYVTSGKFRVLAITGTQRHRRCRRCRPSPRRASPASSRTAGSPSSCPPALARRFVALVGGDRAHHPPARCVAAAGRHGAAAGGLDGRTGRGGRDRYAQVGAHRARCPYPARLKRPAAAAT